MKIKHIITVFLVFSLVFSFVAVSFADGYIITLKEYKDTEMYKRKSILPNMSGPYRSNEYRFENVIDINEGLAYIPIYRSMYAGINYEFFEDIIKAFQAKREVLVKIMNVDHRYNNNNQENSFVSGLLVTFEPQKIQ